MSRITHLEWLESFVAVVDCGGFSAAADEVHRSQSRVSSHVAAVERLLGAYLFDRRHRPVTLTDAGEAFLPHARAVLRHLDRGQADVDGVLGLTRGHVVLGSYPSASACFVPQMLRSFQQRYPNVRVDLVELPTLDLAAAVANGEVHLAVRPRRPEPQAEALAFRPLWHEWLVAILPSDHPLAGHAEPVALDKVAEYPIITIGGRRPDSAARYEAQEAFHRAGLQPEIAWQTDQPQTLASFVRAGFGVGATNQLAAEVSDKSSLVVTRLGERRDGREVAVFWDDGRHQSVAARALIQEILNAPRPVGTVATTDAG